MAGLLTEPRRARSETGPSCPQIIEKIHLTGVRRGLLTLESYIDQPKVDQSLLEELFRNFHSLKGMSGMVGIKPADCNSWTS